MKDEIERITLGVVIVAIVGALMLTAVFGGKADFPGKWLYDYQTLITGLLALGAAYITVNQMKKSDAQARENHLKSLAFQSRPERMLFDRLRSDCKFRLSHHAETLQWKRMKKVPDANNGPSLIQHIATADAVISCRRILSVLNGEDWESAQRIFPSALAFAVQDARKRLEEVVTRFETKNSASDTAERSERNERHARELNQAFTNATEILPGKIFSIVEQVENEALKFERTFEP